MLSFVFLLSHTNTAHPHFKLHTETLNILPHNVGTVKIQIRLAFFFFFYFLPRSFSCISQLLLDLKDCYRQKKSFLGKIPIYPVWGFFCVYVLNEETEELLVLLSNKKNQQGIKKLTIIHKDTSFNTNTRSLSHTLTQICCFLKSF